MTRGRQAAVAATLLALLTSMAPAVRADSTEEDLAKYTRLRQRLLTDFTSVGPDAGQSQPCPERNELTGVMHWGDSTIALGFYMGVLASEFYMLANPTTFPGADGGDPARIDGTLDELYHALYALERLDLNADAAFPPPCTTEPALNGFFIRDDVPADFFVHFPGMTQVTSDFIDPALTNKEMSQDQVYHVQIGLALVVKLVPDSVVVRDRALRRWAMEEAERIGRLFAHDNWVIKNPACGDRPVDRGEAGAAYSFGEGLALGFMTDGAFSPMADDLWTSIWDTLQSAENPAYSNVNNLHMALAIMAVGDAFGAETAQVMATLSALQDWPLYPLLHRVLQGRAASGFCTTAPGVNARARAMLDELPADGEPSCPQPGGPAPHGFTTHNRFIRPADQAYVESPGCEGLRFHGLDYMLLHNLYAIATPGTWMGSPEAAACVPGEEVDAGVDAGPQLADGGAPVPLAASGCDCAIGAHPDRTRSVLGLSVGLGVLLLRRRRCSCIC